MGEIVFWLAVFGVAVWLIPAPSEIEILRHFGLWRD
jgi:hypothetical protein